VLGCSSTQQPDIKGCCQPDPAKETKMRYLKVFLYTLGLLNMSCDACYDPPGADVAATQSVPRTATTPEECRACGGDWGMHGLSDALSETASCDCGTTDAGKRCTDGADCQGMCVANADSPEYDPVDIGPPARGFLVGRCSAFVTVFGCNALVDPGARAAGPVSVAEPPSVICID
jgi:hypothetical protein